MKTKANREEWNRLIWQLADDEISEEDKERLVAILHEEPEARQLYVRNLAMESLLQWENPPSEWVEEAPVDRVSPLVPFGQWVGGLARLPLAAALALGVGLSTYFVFRSTDQVSTDQDLAVNKAVDQGQPLANEETKGDLKASTPLLAVLHNNEEVKVIEDVHDLTITTELATDGRLVNRIYVPESEEVPVQPADRPLEEGVTGFEENELLVKAAFPIDVLESEQGFAAEGQVEVQGEVPAWNGEGVLLALSSDQGVRPFQGSDMIKLPAPAPTSGDVSQSTEILRVIDVRAFGDEIGDRKVTARSSAAFNQSVGIADDGTTYALRLHAIDREAGENLAIGRDVAQVIADRDPGTWQSAESEIALPAGTDYLVVSVSIRKEGDPQVFFANIGGSYADAINVSMEVNGRTVYGTL